MISLRALTVVASLMVLNSGLRAADFLTVDDLKAYYGATFTVTADPKPMDPVKNGGGKVSMLTFMSPEQDVRVATLLIRESESPAAAHKAVEATRAEYGKMGIPVENAPAIGDGAFFFGRQLVDRKSVV